MLNLSMRVKKFNIPDSPGVYFFRADKTILYIGKATSLKDRIKSYFSKDIGIVRSLLIKDMIKEAKSISWIKTNSVLEGLILEANLIKKHKPKYNTREKDDKSFNFVVFTRENFPRVFSARGRDLETRFDVKKDFKYVFGPYPDGGSLKEALKIIRKIFPFFGEEASHLAFYRQLGLLPRANLSRKEYNKTIKNLKLFFEGKTSHVLKNLKEEMKLVVRAREFEKAEEMKRKIFALKHIRDVALIKEDSQTDSRDLQPARNFRIEAYDVAHTGERNKVGAMVVIEDGVLLKRDYRKFNIKKKGGGDIGALKEILERRFSHSEWPLPKLIVVDGGKAQRNAARGVLSGFGYQIPAVAVVKGLGHKAKDILGSKTLRSQRESEILLANSEAHRFALKFHREKRKLK